MQADTPTTNCVRVKNTFIELVEDEAIGEQKLAMKSCPIGRLRCEQPKDGEPVKLHWALADTVTEGVDPAPPENQKLVKRSELGLHGGMSFECDPEVLEGSPMMLSGSILSFTVKNTFIDIITPDEHMEQEKVVTKSCPVRSFLSHGQEQQVKLQWSLGARVAQEAPEEASSGDGDATIADGSVEQEMMQVGVASCPILRRNRRTRTEPASFLNSFSLDDADTGNTEEHHAGNVFRCSFPPPGLCPPPGTPSHGSVLHSSGDCRPCVWHWKRGGCKNGLDCRHCHLCPEGEIKARRKTKVTCMRLGLATPKAVTCQGHGTTYMQTFFPSPFELLTTTDAEQESTTCPSSEEELASGPSSQHDSTLGSDKMHDGKVYSMVLPLSIVQTKEEPDEGTGLMAKDEEQGTASCPVSILQRRNRRNRTEPNKLRWGPSEYVMQAYSDSDDDKESAEDDKMPAPFVPHTGWRPSHGTSSVGSALHGTGECRPCAWFWKPGGCRNGSDCMHCHSCPEGEIRSRKKAKLTTMRLASP